MPARPLTVSLPFSTLTISGLAADLPSPAPSSLLQAERLTHIRAPARVSARGCLNFMCDVLREGDSERLLSAQTPLSANTIARPHRAANAASILATICASSGLTLLGKLPMTL